MTIANTLRALFFLLLSAISAGAAQAQLTSCSVTTSPLAFGTYDPFSTTDTLSTANINLNCSGIAGVLVVYELRLSSGQSGNVLARGMTAPGSPDTLNYQVYVDASRTTVWGDQTGGSTVTGVRLLPFAGGSINHTAYGRLVSGQRVGSGSYSDPPILTVMF